MVVYSWRGESTVPGIFDAFTSLASEIARSLAFPPLLGQMPLRPQGTLELFYQSFQ